MNNKPKNAKRMILMIPVAVVVFFLVLRVGSGSFRSAVRIGYVGSEGRSSWSGSYRSLDGKMWKNIHPEGDMLHIRVETQSGTISIQVKDKEGNVIFSENDMGTNNFDVEVQGKVSVLIEADNHRGGFEISSEP